MRPTVQVVGRRLDPEHYRLRDFLTRTAQPYDWHEAGSAEADLLLEQLGLVDAELPVLVDGDRSFTGATVETVADGIAPHPTLSEAIKEAGLVALGRAIHLPPKRAA